MKKQLLWASLLLSLTFTQSGVTSLVVATDHTVVATGLNAIKSRLGVEAPGSIAADVETIATTLGAATTETVIAKTDALLASAKTHLITKNRPEGATNAFVTLDQAVEDIANITVDAGGIARADALAGLGITDAGDILAEGNDTAAFNLAVVDVQEALVETPAETSISAEIGAVSLRLVDIGSQGSLGQDIDYLAGIIGGNPTDSLETLIRALLDQINGVVEVV